MVGTYLTITSSDGPEEVYNRSRGNCWSPEGVANVTVTSVEEKETARDAAIRAN